MFANDTKVWRIAMDSDGYVCYLVCGNGFIGVHICQNYQIIFFKYVYFHQFDPNKVVKNVFKTSAPLLPSFICWLYKFWCQSFFAFVIYIPRGFEDFIFVFEL